MCTAASETVADIGQGSGVAETAEIKDLTVQWARLHARIAELGFPPASLAKRARHEERGLPLPAPLSVTAQQPCAATPPLASPVTTARKSGAAFALLVDPGAACENGTPPVLACACLASGSVAVLHPRCVVLWKPRDASLDAPWQPAMRLEGAAGAAFDSLAVLHRLLHPAAATQPLLAACGCIGASAFGASIFRLDVATAGQVDVACSTPKAAAPLPWRRAVRHLRCTPHRPSCAQLLPSPPLEGVEGGHGMLLAIGATDGRVRLWRLTHPASTNWDELPAPSDERPALAACGVGGSARAAVLDLCALPGNLGLLVGGFAWGAALWQVGSRTLVNIFERQGHPSLSPPQQLYAAGLEHRQAAALVAALPSPAASLDGTVASDSAARLGPDDALGCFVVASALCWVDSTSAGDEPLARTFALTRRTCEPRGPGFYRSRDEATTGTAVGLAVGGGRACTMLVCLASDASYVSGTDARGINYVWNARLGVCLAALCAGPAAARVLGCSHAASSRDDERTTLLLLVAMANGLHRCSLSCAGHASVDVGARPVALQESNCDHVQRSSPRWQSEDEPLRLDGFSRLLPLSQSEQSVSFAY